MKRPEVTRVRFIVKAQGKRLLFRIDGTVSNPGDLPR